MFIKSTFFEEYQLNSKRITLSQAQDSVLCPGVTNSHTIIHFNKQINQRLNSPVNHIIP